MQWQRDTEGFATRIWKMRAVSILVFLSSLFLHFFLGGKAYAVSVNPVAISVYGQFANTYTTNTVNQGSLSAISLNQPAGIAVDSNGGVYIADTGNNRVLYFASGSTTATRVYGQNGSFISNNSGVSSTSLNNPTSLALDSSSNLYVADASNNRVLYFASGSTTATRVYGQGGSYTSNTANNGGVSSTSLNNPTGLALDSSGNLYVADQGNNRVLYFASASTTATRVYGQGGSYTSNTANNGGISSTSLYQPFAVTLSSLGSLYVADSNNNRVLYFASGSTTATRVYGQNGSFTSNTANNGGISSTSLYSPKGVLLDTLGNLYVADASNNRILFYTSISTTATRIFGQGGSYTSNTANNGGISSTSLNNPTALAFDNTGDLYVADDSNNRALYYAFLTSLVSTTASMVYGQDVSFTTNTANNGGLSASSLKAPAAVATDSSGGVYVADSGNNRVLYYAAGSVTATRVYGQGGSFTTSTANNGGVSATSLSNPTGVALDSSGNLYVADQGNNRVLYYASGITTATRVYGQVSSYTTNTANNGGVSSKSLNGPRAVAVDSSGNLYVADQSNNRILYFASGTTTATNVYGQGGSYTSNTANNGGISATSLSAPSSIAVDSSGNLYVADQSNNRILYFASGTTTATNVYGQGGSFTSNTANNGGISATSLSSPVGVAVDSNGDITIADGNNNRVLYYPTGNTTATRVYGQTGSFTTTTTGVTNSSSFNGLSDVRFDRSGDLYVDDSTGNRILKFQSALMVSTQPSSTIIVNNAFTVALGLYDVGSGLAYSDMTGSASIAIKTGTGGTGATLGGTTTINASAGYATFSNLTLDTIASNFILTASTTNYGTASTNSFNTIGVLTETVASSTNTWSVALTGKDQTKTYTLPAINVTDSTATGNGWHLTITSTQFTTGGATPHTLSTTASSITSVNTVCASGSCTMPTTNVSYPLTIPSATTAPTAISLYNATATTGKGQFTVTPTASVAIPGNAYNGTYTSTITIAIISGP